MSDIEKKLNDYVDGLVLQFEDALVPKIYNAMPGEYNPDWAAEDIQDSYEDARRNFIDSLVNDILLAYYPGEDEEEL